jgi:hypothetical protein
MENDERVELARSMAEEGDTAEKLLEALRGLLAVYDEGQGGGHRDSPGMVASVDREVLLELRRTAHPEDLVPRGEGTPVTVEATMRLSGQMIEGSESFAASAIWPRIATEVFHARSRSVNPGAHETKTRIHLTYVEGSGRHSVVET